MKDRVRFKDYLSDYLEFNNISVKEFAERINITPKHLNAILKGDSDLSSEVISNISFITDIESEFIYNVESSYKLGLAIEHFLKEKNMTLTEYLNLFKYNYIIKNNYIKLRNPLDKVTVLKDILKFLRVSSPEQIYKIENNALFKTKNNKFELLILWLEKCYREMLKQNVKDYKKENIEILVNFILKEAKLEKFDKHKLQTKFNECGIYLVIEEDIPGSKIRGAFKVHRTKPAIYLTLKHKRIADIYFSLLHELAHCKSDYNQAKAGSLVSFIDDVEDKADKTSYNWMVNDNYYKKIKTDSNYKLEEEKTYPKSFVVYRLALDKKISYSNKLYQKYNKKII